MEITFKTLDRVTVNGLYNKNTVADITNFAYCVEDNTYYLLDDPIVLNQREDIEVTENGYKIVIKDEAKVSIITCNTLKDVYKQLINRLAKNDLNPFILYKKFKEGYVTGNVEIDEGRPGRGGAYTRLSGLTAVLRVGSGECWRRPAMTRTDSSPSDSPVKQTLDLPRYHGEGSADRFGVHCSTVARRRGVRRCLRQVGGSCRERQGARW